jgi:hypothetical protein
MKSRVLVPLIVVVIMTAAFAQEISKGTKIEVRTKTLVSSDRNYAGDPVDATLARDVVVNGKVIAHEGDPARCIVAFADPSRGGRSGSPGSVALRLDTIETPEGTYHVSTSQYTRQGQGRGRSPFPSGGGISVDSAGGIQRQSPFPSPETNGVSFGGGGEAIIPPEIVITFKAAAISKLVPKN